MREKANEYATREIDALMSRLMPEVLSKLPPFVLAAFPVDRIMMALREVAINLLAKGWEDGCCHGSEWGQE